MVHCREFEQVYEVKPDKSGNYKNANVVRGLSLVPGQKGTVLKGRTRSQMQRWGGL
jgi:hypothetical protein